MKLGFREGSHRSVNKCSVALSGKARRVPGLFFDPEFKDIKLGKTRMAQKRFAEVTGAMQVGGFSTVLGA